MGEVSAASVGSPKDEEQPALRAGHRAAPRGIEAAAVVVPAAVCPAESLGSRGSHLTA